MGKRIRLFQRILANTAGSSLSRIPLHTEPARLFVRSVASATQCVPGAQRC